MAVDGFRLLTGPKASSFEELVFIAFVFLECEAKNEAEFSDPGDEAGGSEEPGCVIRFW